MLKIETGKDNPILRTVCDPVKTSEWKQYVKIGKEMIAYIKNPELGGVGLAGPQIGKAKRIMVVSLLTDWDDEDFSTVLMFNPEILETSKEMTSETEEGCLSLPDTQRGKVMRHKEIKIRYFDERMKEKIIRVSDLASVVVQHEIDHLDGILYIDKLVR